MTIDERQSWYNISATKGLGPAAAQKIVRYLRDRRLPATALIDQPAEVLQHEIGLAAAAASALAEQLASPVALPDVPPGVELLTPGDEHFPDARFIDANPPLAPVLWATGSTSLLAHRRPALAVAGSRGTNDEVLELVHGLAKEASCQGWMVVSGLAQGVDSAAHEGALVGPSGTIGVLASGIANTSRSWSPGDVDSMCLVSQFQPGDPWSGARAMQRNSTIAGLADRVLVAAAGTSGGSWEMAQLCLKRKKFLFVLDLPPDVASGNQKLVHSGAIPVDPSDALACLAPRDGPLTLFS